MAGPHPRRCSPRHGIGLDFVSNADSPAVELRGLRKRFGGTVAVDGLDLRLERGHVLALLGPNGAGKTTTVEICEGFQRPDDGSVRVLGLDPAAQGDACLC